MCSDNYIFLYFSCIFYFFLYFAIFHKQQSAERRSLAEKNSVKHHAVTMAALHYKDIFKILNVHFENMCGFNKPWMLKTHLKYFT
jgi:hypothetical protein